MQGCFRGCSRRVFEVRITLSKSLTCSRQFRNEIHGDPYTEAFTRRFNLERTIPSRATAKSVERLLYDIRTIGAYISAILSLSCFTVSTRVIRRLLYRPVAYCNPPRLRGFQVVEYCCQYKGSYCVILLED